MGNSTCKHLKRPVKQQAKATRLSNLRMAPASSLAQNGCVHRPCSPAEQQARDPTSGPALPFPTPRSARPSLALRALLGLALAARRWGRATYLPHRTAKVQEPETFTSMGTRVLQSDWSASQHRDVHKTKVQEPESPASKNANPRGRERFP